MKWGFAQKRPMLSDSLTSTQGDCSLSNALKATGMAFLWAALILTYFAMATPLPPVVLRNRKVNNCWIISLSTTCFIFPKAVAVYRDIDSECITRARTYVNTCTVPHGLLGGPMIQLTVMHTHTCTQPCACCSTITALHFDAKMHRSPNKHEDCFTEMSTHTTWIVILPKKSLESDWARPDPIIIHPESSPRCRNPLMLVPDEPMLPRRKTWTWTVTELFFVEPLFISTIFPGITRWCTPSSSGVKTRLSRPFTNKMMVRRIKGIIPWSYIGL